jgi:hypothetical protein
VVPGGPLEGVPNALSMPHTARVCVPVQRIPLVWPQTGPGWLSLVIVPELVVILIAVSAVAEDATQAKRRTSPVWGPWPMTACARIS